MDAPTYYTYANRQQGQYALSGQALAPFKRQLRQWAAQHEIFLYLDSHTATAADWECLVAVGSVTDCIANAGADAFGQLKALANGTSDWLFGYFAYDLKNEVERLQSHNFDGLGFPDLYFFQPETVVGIRASGATDYTLTIQTHKSPPEYVYQAILSESTTPYVPTNLHPALRLRPRFAPADYLDTVRTVQAHIAAGDLYEMNLCQEFYADHADMEPLAVFERLYARTLAPFTAFGRWADRWLLSASPERFLQKQGRQLRSQPIKGTRRRSPDPVEDARIRAELATNEKERAENVMIVDLVRNDLARHCVPGSVRVTELFGIYSFATVHQMISTVEGKLRPDVHGLDALCAAFPMGSMTGAPKVMAMELIERYERTRRGLYSGAVGYLDPKGDFDFNVVIRSILYNATQRYVSCQVGSALVYDAVAEQEYDECLVKLNALQAALL